MKKYYFLQIKGLKKGPIELDELSKFKIKSDTLVWRSDQDDWKSAKEFEELNELIFASPPLTPREIKGMDFLKDLKRKLPKMIVVISLISLAVAVFTTIEAITSYKTYKAELDQQRKEYEKSLNDENRLKSSYREIFIFSVAVKRYSGEITIGGDTEEEYSKKQIFIFRPIYLIYSPIYLNKNERENEFLLLFNLFLSTFALLSLITLLFLIWRFLKP